MKLERQCQKIVIGNQRLDAKVLRHQLEQEVSDLEKRVCLAGQQNSPDLNHLANTLQERHAILLWAKQQS